jgi:hypothetical protein
MRAIPVRFNGRIRIRDKFPIGTGIAKLNDVKRSGLAVIQ